MRFFAILLIALSTLPASAVDKAFKPGWQRYPTPDSLVKRWARQYPLTAERSSLPGQCSVLTESNQGFLGVAVALSGDPSQNQPGVAFTSWVYECVRLCSSYERGILDSMGHPLNPVTDAWWAGFAGHIRWSELSRVEKENLLTGLFENIFGPFEVFEEVSPGFNRQRLLSEVIEQLDRSPSEELPIHRLLGLRFRDGPVDAYVVAVALFSLEDLMMY